MLKFFTIFLAIILVATSATADERVVGHIKPLPEEFLNNPIVLDCGATIQEMRSKQNISALNSLCTDVVKHFHIYADANELKRYHAQKFRWNISFIPASDCYRCLNDHKYRFKGRFISNNVIGLTDLDNEYSFILSNNRDKEYKETYIHELFHALSMYYGVYESHPGNYRKKTATDEEHAEAFTEWLLDAWGREMPREESK